MKDYIRYRRDLHAIPEVGFQEEKTGAYIAEKLAGLDCLTERIAGTGSFAFFDHGAEETIAFRTDIDALPIPEETGLPFAAQNGCMHACGHDAHMAMMLALADWLNENRAGYTRNVLLVFQPAEERLGDGGARIVCGEGLLERFNVTKIFGLHVWPQVKAGALAVRPGPVMAQASNLDVEVRGRSAHCGRPDLGIDALAALSDFIAELNRYKREEIALGTEYILHLGIARAGDAPNIICQSASASGNVRAFEPELFDRLCRKVRDTAAAVDTRYGTVTEIRFSPENPAVDNDPALLEEYRAVMAEAGIEVVEGERTMIAEDFSFYQKRVPGILAFLGLGDTPPLHNNRFTFDEELMETGIRAFTALVERFAR